MKNIFLLTLFFHSLLYADLLFIEDRANHITLVETPKVYYTSKSGSSLAIFYKPDYETKGIRLKEGMGTSFVEWKNIKSIEIHKKRDDKIFLATMNNAKSTLSVLLVNPIGGFFGKSHLGDFSIDFKNIKKIDVVSKEHMNIKAFLLSQYSFMQKKLLPSSVAINDEKSLIAFASKHLKLEKKHLKVMRFSQYIVIHFNDEEYEKKHPSFKERKFGEAVVINKSYMNFVAFRMSKT